MIIFFIYTFIKNINKYMNKQIIKIKKLEDFLNEENTPNNQKIVDFKKELKKLFEKYNAYIWCDIEGDTHGLSYKMVVEIDRKDYTLTERSDIDENDL